MVAVLDSRGRRLFTGGAEGTVNVYNLLDGALLRKINRPKLGSVMNIVVRGSGVG
jgi:hypothetical protein